MAEDSDIKIVEVTSLHSADSVTFDDEDHPLLNLIKHLVNYVDIDQNTPLTNSELKDILNKELVVNINTKFESEVYMLILKKFLKTWPRWEAIDRAVKASKKNPEIDIEKKLLNEYKILKKYLQFMIDSSKSLMDESVAKAGGADKTAEKGGVLEVYAKKEKLKCLFLNKPSNNTILNMTETTKTKINLHSFQLEDLINCPYVHLTVSTPMLEMTHCNYSEFQHTLINKAISSIQPPPTATKGLYSQPCPVRGKINNLKHTKVSSIINDLLQKLDIVNLSLEEKEILRVIFETLRWDLNIIDCHEQFEKTSFYKYFPVKFPYVRYHVTVIDEPSQSNKKNFDLHLEEYIIPCIEFSILKAIEYDSMNLLCFTDNNSSITMKCLLCDEEYQGLQGVIEFKNHFNDNHSDEDDLLCTGCNIKYSYAFLSRNWWRHECPNDNDST